MTELDHAAVRKRRLEPEPQAGTAPTAIDVASVATLAYSSEDAAHPVEHILDGSAGQGATKWVSDRPDTVEQIVVEFDQPQAISRLAYDVEETEHERTQEMRIEASTDGGQTYRQVLVQEYTFSPHGATHEREDVRVDLPAVTHLRLVIVPHKHGSGRATLSRLQLFA